MSGLSGFARAVRGHPLVLDGALAGLLYAGMMLVAGFAPASSTWRLTPGLAVLAAVGCGASVLRRRYPVPALALAVAPIMVSPLFGVRHNLLPVAVILPLLNVFLRVERRTALLVAGCAVAVVTIAATLAAMAHQVRSENTPPGFSALIVGVMCIAIGEARRNRLDYVREAEERARRAEHGREEEARRRVAEERLRISRDLHDILAHHIALITVQAGVAAHVLERRPDQAVEALEHIRTAGAQALTDLHETITVLRERPLDQSAGDATGPAEPTAGLDRLDDLLDAFTQAGLKIETQLDGAPRRLPATADVAAYRVIQEALTNVRKHAGPVQARIHLDYGPTRVSVLVQNDQGDRAENVRHTERAGHAGHGLLGMRERVRTLGGELEAGPVPGGGFRVAACIPLADAAANEPRHGARMLPARAA